MLPSRRTRGGAGGRDQNLEMPAGLVDRERKGRGDEACTSSRVPSVKRCLSVVMPTWQRGPPSPSAGLALLHEGTRRRREKAADPSDGREGERACSAAEAEPGVRGEIMATLLSHPSHGPAGSRSDGMTRKGELLFMRRPRCGGGRWPVGRPRLLPLATAAESLFRLFLPGRRPGQGTRELRLISAAVPGSASL